MTDPTPSGQHPDTVLTPLDIAATRLGISQEAVRKRIERGKLPGEKHAGRWHAWLPRPDEDTAQAAEPSGQHPDSGRTDPDSVRTGEPALIEHLQAQVTFLQEQLRERTTAEAELRRLVAQAQNLAIPATTLDAPESRPGAPGATNFAQEHDDAGQSPQRSRWRRWLGLG
jgi:hypothetical protein